MRELDTDIRNAAFEWRAILADDHVAASDRMAFDAWIAADPRHKAAYEQAARFWRELGALGRANLDPAFFRPSLQERARSALWRAGHMAGGCLPRKPAFAAVKMAAACAVLLVAVLYAPDLAPNEYLRVYDFAAAIGQTRTVDMEDGSQITLGADTSLSVTFTAHARKVRMSAGEAFFQVSKDPDRPFVVISEDLRVTVHGTAFDLRSNALGAQVAVTEGVVSVDYPIPSNHTPPGSGSPSPSPARRESRILRAGDVIKARKDRGLGTVASIRPESVGAWRRNMLVYIDAPLSELVSDLNRYRSQKIRISDADIAALKVTATFSSNDIDGMLQTLTEVFPVQLDSSQQGLVLRRTR